MEEKRSILSLETLIPIGLVVILIGGVVWLTTMFNDIIYLKRDLADTKSALTLQIADVKNNLVSQISEIKSDVKEVKQLILDQK